MNTHSSLLPPSSTPFFEGESEISTKLGKGRYFFEKICMETKRRKAEEMQKS